MKIRLLSSSEEENEENDLYILIHFWELFRGKMQISIIFGRAALRNIFRIESGPVGYAKLKFSDGINACILYKNLLKLQQDTYLTIAYHTARQLEKYS